MRNEQQDALDSIASAQAETEEARKVRKVMMKTGAQIVWECLVREGVTDRLRLSGRRDSADLRRDARNPPSATSSCATSRARRTWPTATRARAAGSAWPSRPPVPARPTWSRHRDRDDGFVADRLHHRPGGQQADRHPTRSRRSDITGITLPITKHNYLVTRAERHRAARSARRSPSRSPAAPARCSSTSPRTRSRARASSTGTRRRSELPGYRPDLSPAATECLHALALINAAKRPLILAGHGIMLSGADAISFASSPRRRTFPIAMTLLGIGGIPASHPLNLGMMGMHGEAWVNKAIQEADLLIAFGMRFDDRVTGNLKTYAPNAKKIHIDIDPAEINKNVRVDVALVGDLRDVLEELLPRVEAAIAPSGCAHSRAQGRLRGPRHPEPARQTGICTPRT